MGIRETLHRNRILVSAIAVAAITVSLFLGWGMSGAWQKVPVHKAFYTTDDGLTTFVDDPDRYPPFMHEGRQAVRAYKFACNDGTEFIGYLERFTEEAKEALERMKKKGAEQDAEFQKHYMLGRETKIPGPAGRWKGFADPQYNVITTPTCGDGVQPQSVGP